MFSSPWRMSNAMVTLCLFMIQLVTEFDVQCSLNSGVGGGVGFFFIRYHSIRPSGAPDLLEKYHEHGYIEDDSSKKKPHNCSRQLQW